MWERERENVWTGEDTGADKTGYADLIIALEVTNGRGNYQGRGLALIWLVQIRG